MVSLILKIKMKTPFTEQEKEVMDLLIKAHNKFVALDRTHPSEMQNWVIAFHTLQGIMMNRIVRRDYPKHFNKI